MSKRNRKPVEPSDAPGPWKFGEPWKGELGRRAITIQDARGGHVCNAHYQSDRPEQKARAESIANTIVAAPDMLAALLQVDPMAKTLMDEAGKGPATNWGVVNKCLCDVIAAIAKATGTAK